MLAAAFLREHWPLAPSRPTSWTGYSRSRGSLPRSAAALSQPSGQFGARPSPRSGARHPDRAYYLVDAPGVGDVWLAGRAVPIATLRSLGVRAIKRSVVARYSRNRRL